VVALQGVHPRAVGDAPDLGANTSGDYPLPIAREVDGQHAQVFRAQRALAAAIEPHQARWRVVEPQREEERLLLLLAEKISGKGGDLAIVGLLFGDGNAAPIPVPDVEAVEVLPCVNRQIRNLHTGLREALIPGRIQFKTTPPPMPASEAAFGSAMVGVEDLSRRSRHVALGFEMLRQRRFADDLHAAPPVLLVAKHTARGRQHAREQRGA
jgi:hypothetical protein